MEEVQHVTTIAKGISDYGALAVMAAIYLLLSASMMIAIFKWFRSIINQILEDNRTQVAQTIAEERKQTEMLIDISEGIRAETQLKVQNIANLAFDLAVEQVCRVIKNVREINHITDREATGRRIRKLVTNIHDDRNNRFSHFTYKGRKLSDYCLNEWVDQVCSVVEGEIYHENGPDNKRAFANVKMAYDDIRNDFFHNINQ